MYVDTFAVFNMKQVTGIVLVIAMVAGAHGWEYTPIDCGSLFGYKVKLPETSIAAGTDVVIEVPDVCDGAKPNGLSVTVGIDDEAATVNCRSSSSIFVHRNGDPNAEGNADIKVYCPSAKRHPHVSVRGWTPPIGYWPRR